MLISLIGWALTTRSRLRFRKGSEHFNNAKRKYMTHQMGYRGPRAGEFGLLGLGMLGLAACTTAPPEPESVLVQRIEVTDASATDGPMEESAVADNPLAAEPVASTSVGAASETVCGFLPDGEDVADSAGAVYQAGWHTAIIELEAPPTTFRQRLSLYGSPDAVGSSFRARVVDSVAQGGVTLPPIIEIHQWDAMVRADRVAAPMEPMTGGRGRVMPQPGGRFLVVLAPDNLFREGWRLMRSWSVGPTGNIRGAALGQTDGTSTMTAFESFRRESRPRSLPNMWTDWQRHVARRSAAGMNP